MFFHDVSYGRWTFCQLQSTFHAVAKLSVNFPCNNGTSCLLSIRQHHILSNSINFHQLSMHPRDLPSTFLVSTRPSINFLCGCETFYKLPSTLVHPPYFRQIPSNSINFPCAHRRFCQLFIRQWDLLSTSVNFSCVRETFREPSVRPRYLHSTFHASVGPSVNFNQQSVQSRDYL